MFKRIFTITLVLVLCLYVEGNPVPKESEEEGTMEPEDGLTVPNTTWNFSTIEEILEEVAKNKREQVENSGRHAINKRALGCTSTQVAYGSNNGTAFVDFTGSGTDPWPCGVDITEIRIRSGSRIDAIQVRYRNVDHTIFHKPRRGGSGGTLRVISLQSGERITGVAGLICRSDLRGTLRGTFVRQLLFFSQKQDGQKVTYGPYGTGTYRHGGYTGPCRIFGVNGKINSIFGKVRNVSPNNPSSLELVAIGFYYEDESTYSQDAYNTHSR